jgi:glycine/sarcosine N-methyltransferase
MRIRIANLPVAKHVVRFWQGLRYLWLRGLTASRFGREFLIPLLLAAVVRLVFKFLGYESHSIPREIALDAVLLIVGYLAVRESYLWGLKPIRGYVFNIARAAQDPGRSFLLQLAVVRTQEILQVVEGLATTGYDVAAPELMRGWFATFFENGGYTYSGVDSHLPSSYVDKYDWYLVLHTDSLRRNVRQAPDVRIIEADRNALTKDYYLDKASYARFTKWHSDNNVALRWVEEDTAKALRRRFKLTEDIDVGLWDTFAVLFQTNSSSSIRLSMSFKSDKDVHQGELTYKALGDFIKAMHKASEPFPDSPPGVETVDDHLASRWRDYVDPDVRIDPNREWAQFLLPVLDDRKIILDAAAGIGCESVMLLKTRKYSVFTNEVDERFGREATIFAEQHKVSLNMSQCLWEELSHSFAGGLRFEAVLVIGNSLCLVMEADRRSQCVQEFYDILYPGGILVIDERNFSTILDNREDILADPMKRFVPAMHGDVMYQGHTLRGYPCEIRTDQVMWRFFDNPAAAGHDRKYRDLALYPFKHGEVFALLKKAGFRHIDVYGDLKPIASDAPRMPEKGLMADASFLTYVATK